MYPRNAATPPTITIGQVVQISDGAVQTTGASVRVKTGSGAWGAGAGTLACDTTSGVWTYAPTQGETDAEAFLVAVYKASCIGCDKTVITSASATAGKAVLSGETHTGAVIPTVTTLENAPSDSSGTTTLLSRVTSTRAGYLDNLSGGAVALAATALSTATWTATIAGRIDAAISSRLASASYTAPLDAAGVRSAVGLATANLDTQLGDIPTVAEFEARTLVSASYGTAVNQLTIIGYIDAEISSIISSLSTIDGKLGTPVDIGLGATIAAGINELHNDLTQVHNDAQEVRDDWANGGRLDLILDAIAANVVLVLADTGADGVVLSAATCNKIADHVRRRTQANVEASSDGDTLSLLSEYGFIQMAQESAASGTTLTVKRTDGTTTLGTRTLATDAAADPVTGVS